MASAADLIGDGQELLGTLLRLSRRSDGSKDQIERSVSKALAARIQEIHKHRCGQDIDRQLLSGVCTEVEILLNEIANDGDLVLSAALNPDNLPAVLHSHASQRRLNVEEAAEPFFDELVEAVAAEYSAVAPWSPRFQIEAFKSILSGVDEIQENSRRSLDAHAVTHDKLDTLSSRLAEVARHENNPSRVIFGSRPDVVTGDRCIERDEKKHLNALIVDPTKQRTVLVGMRGCGKTQLAAALAQECQDADWSLVAWVHAGSQESIKSGLVELAKDLKIDTSDHPTQEQIVGRCLNYLRSSGGSDRLIVFDNVEDINDLRGSVPTGEGLRVVATTTNDKGWNYQGWDPIRIGVFDRETSIDYLLTVTDSADREAAYTLAERLGDLPLALAQAAASARNGDLSLNRYLDRLDSYGSERAIRPVPGDYYTDDVATALSMAIEDALENLEDGVKQAARYLLGALALLAESGVPTRWLDPTIEQQDGRGLQGSNRAEAEDAHDALTELIHRSIVQQSADGTTIMLHRLQAQVLRNSWNNNELDDARAAATGLLGSVNISRYPSNDTKARRQEALDLVDQLRSIGTQEHSQVLFESPHTSEALFQAFSHASDLGLPYEALTLDVAVDALEGLLGPDHPDALTSRNDLAYVYYAAGRLEEAIPLFKQVLTDSIRVLGEDHPDALTSRNNLASAYRAAGRLEEAITLFEQVLPDRIRVLGEDHPDTLNSRNNLAYAYESAGRLEEAITLYEQVLPDRIRVLGEDHPSTLNSRNNLAGAYESAGHLTEAITLYEQVLPDSIRVLGEDHPDTLTSRNNLAYAYCVVGRLEEAITLFEQVLPDRIRVLGEDHPDTLSSRNNLAGAYHAMGRLEEAITLFEQVTKDCARILGEDHPLTKTVRENLEAARRELAQREDSSPTEEREQED
ncbi:tetratricopeptide repeat protein [Schaalia odontolytica]|uniref:tetratricopeptide repeat protein n=3 Tax=Schaalia odontolytica TaxID=1660 RepID=UPI00210D2146|nr:tetratricopeptide repeat protein [Schaalia odontolytica]MCQ5272314.1 tetratricopeptide repeat protein [Schaalia odontolytica]